MLLTLVRMLVQRLSMIELIGLTVMEIIGVDMDVVEHVVLGLDVVGLLLLVRLRLLCFDILGLQLGTSMAQLILLG